MNFERLIQTFNDNYSKISNKYLALRNVIDEYSILKKNCTEKNWSEKTTRIEEKLSSAERGEE